MKHLKTFENNNQKLFMVVMKPPVNEDYEKRLSYEDRYEFFSNMESAKNCVLNNINEDINDINGPLDDIEDIEDYGIHIVDKNKLFISYEDAIKVIDDYAPECWMYSIEEVKVSDDIKLSEEILRLRDIKKYNL